MLIAEKNLRTFYRKICACEQLYETPVTGDINIEWNLKACCFTLVANAHEK